jgi:aminopeptidase N
MKLYLKYLPFVFISCIFSCKVSEQPADQSTGAADVVEVKRDSVEIPDEGTYELRLYRGEKTRHFQLLHTKLDVRFDWENQQLNGQADLMLRPYFYEQSELVLDAKDFDFHQITILKGEDQIMPEYDYDGKKVTIDLGETYTKDQKLYIQINYTAKPNEGRDSLDFSNDKKGLYFINPTGEIKAKPRQIWTHGETETASKWFPTIDAPNQKSTQEIFITVDAGLKTLSNGKLIYSKSNSDSTRTDYWKMDKPHAPYLFMLAVGDFAIVQDEWNGKEVSYYVEPPYEQYADDIFGNTPEMISYFSETFNYPFPWEKYSQIVVRDFVSGAMENTTASVFMEDLHVNSRELIDYNWDDIIAHELLHQWFGDLVTCESWANIPLNEAFATYGEYLWKYYKFGRDEGDYHLYEELQTYLDEAETKQVDLIRFDYLVDDEMFDNHSYAKGGLILHMLRNYLGDEAFFHSLEYYLKKHAFGKAEVHELRLAFEHISGEDLNWFFNQWFMDAGHPVLKVEEEYVEEERLFILKVWQEQNTDFYPVYKLPLTLDLWENGKKDQYLIEIDRPYQEFEFEDISAPELLLLDSDYLLVGEINHPKSTEQWLYQYQQYDSSFRARYEAFQELMEGLQEPSQSTVLSEALQDVFWVIREETLLRLEKDTSNIFDKYESIVTRMAGNDPNTLVRGAAISLLFEKGGSRYKSIYRSNLYDSSYTVAGNALYAYLQSDAEDISEVLTSLKSENNFNITSSMADYFIMQGDDTQYSWFAEKLEMYGGSDLWYFIKLFGMYLVSASPEEVQQGIEELALIGKNHHQFYNRLSAYQTLQLLSDIEGVPQIIEDLQNSEKDARIANYFK